MKTVSRSVEETSEIAAKWVEGLEPLAERATIVGLAGDLGSGKTAFTKAVAKALGVTEFVTSPTFVLEKIYQLPGHQGFAHLIHIDAYRLEGGSELLDIGFADIRQKSDNLILIEWPEKVADALPSDMVKIDFTFVNENEREINFV